MRHKKTARKVIWFFLVVSLFCLVLIIINNQKRKQKTFTITTTTTIIGNIVQNIVGDQARVEVIIQGNIDPHSYLLKYASDPPRLQDADLIIGNGLLLEGNLAQALQAIYKIHPEKVYFISQALDNNKIISDTNNVPDPHIWLRTDFIMQILPAITQQIKDKDPANKELYETNSQQYLAKLQALDEKRAKIITSIPKEKRHLIMPHNAFGYWSAYGFKINSLKGVSTRLQSSFQKRKTIVDKIIQHDIPAIFLEESTNNKGIKAIIQDCAKRGYRLKEYMLYTDTLAEGKGYIATMECNLDNIQKALAV